ncbi:acyl-CoA dehydrogenase family protein [Zavarzinia aquatilis]|uniref:Acyl-CoA dehydrogenase n=1 Tax=Zavarzinia aquatilis TaxID=2211142 RepID=A0A317EEY6_9PROT|nr:acyl-CoA dehydrogenase family protein [Zavarzinia aquatilis]PWR25321.1 acyl-CoA dehydrogenase [Zavarzinia aquatilis]
MNIDPAPELEAFRLEVASFLDTAPTPAILEAGRKTTSIFAPFEAVMEWQGMLFRRGWAAPDWPVEHGGTGWTVEQKYVFAEEYGKRDLPPLLPNALRMVGPLIIDLGTEAQKMKYLPGILSGEDYWAQGYSEPNAGSDLAALSCAAVAEGDDYIINGSKIWTTLAHKANRMFMLVRTLRSDRKQDGITFLLLDRMDFPGMTVRPIVGLDGVPEQCEVFFDNVRVPQSARVGAENDGWSVAKHLLKYERGGGAVSPSLRRYLRMIRDAAATTPGPTGGLLVDDPVFQRDLGALEIDVTAFQHFELLAFSGHALGDDPAFPSINKTVSAELTQRISVLMRRTAGIDALAMQLAAFDIGSGPESLTSDFELIAMPYYLNSRATSIYAGTNEVQRDLIARSLTRS